MTETIVSLNDAQFQKLLAAQHGIWPVASVFVSALLAMITGIIVGFVVERIRAWFERRKSVREKLEREVQQINAVVSGLAFDLELLFHNASQNILPHYHDTREIFTLIERDESDEHILRIIRPLGDYRYLFMTFPDTYLVEYDFSNVLPFVIERDPNTVKHSGWLINGIREIRAIMTRRNRLIETAMDQDRPAEGARNLENFRRVIRGMMNIANTECIITSQLLEVLINLIKALEKTNAAYPIDAKKSRLTLPTGLEETMSELKAISESVPIPGTDVKHSSPKRD